MLYSINCYRVNLILLPFLWQLLYFKHLSWTNARWTNAWWTNALPPRSVSATVHLDAGPGSSQSDVCIEGRVVPDTDLAGYPVNNFA